MKKFFSVIAVLCLALTANADVLWSESCHKGENTYVNKDDFKGYWPYASQWFEKDNFENTYTSVKCYSCSIRNKKINGDSENSIGLYFGAGKVAKDCYVTFEGSIYTAKDGDMLMFEICSPEKGSPEEDIQEKTIIKINDVSLTIPEIAVPATAATTTVSVALSAGEIKTLHISFDNLGKQKFITDLRIEGDLPSAVENVKAEAPKAKKMVDENGQLVIIRGNVRYNAVGAVIE